MNRATIYKVLLSMLVLTACENSPTVKKFPGADLEAYYDLNFTGTERDSILQNLEGYKESFTAIHKHLLTNDVPMSLVFDPLPAGFEVDTNQKPIDWGLPTNVSLPANKNDLAFYTVSQLASLIKTKKITSLELTNFYLDRLKKYNDSLLCVVSITEELALAQAKRADDEIANGKYRGPLHGIPYGIKDLLSVEGTKTTWGAEPYRDQSLNNTATVVKKLEGAGAVLIVKLSMGALAMGDIWFGGITKNPWNPKQGSSGSSAGSASATAAGLVPFAIGTETWGSIISPATRCGVTGLRPTYGMVSRSGAMALCWSMDKIGPICRSVLDCALVLDVIRGKDDHDASTRNVAFNYSARTDIRKLKVGYIKSYFEDKYDERSMDSTTLVVLKQLGVTLTPVELPKDIPLDALTIMLSAEAAAAFDELTRSNRDSLLSNQLAWAWPNTFRSARFIPAVEYINASRIRQQLINAYYEKTKDFDVIVTPSYGGDQLLMTNMTGHPCVVLPNGFNEKGAPTSISFLGKLYGESSLVALARAYQEATDWDEKHPERFQR